MAFDPTEFKEFVLDNISQGLRQAGINPQSVFHNDLSLSPDSDEFDAAVDAAQGGIEKVFTLSQADRREISKAAGRMATAAKIAEDVAEEFLTAISKIDVEGDLKKIGDAIGIPDLSANPGQFLQNPGALMQVSGLEKGGFVANGLGGITGMYSKFGSLQNASPKLTDAGLTKDILSNVGGFGAIGNTIESLVGEAKEKFDRAVEILERGDPGTAPGTFLASLNTGYTIPTTVVNKNPLLQGPSYIGKTMFGELKRTTDVIDLEEVFAKTIAAFPDYKNGSATTSAGFMNFSSFEGTQSMTAAINTMAFGVPSVEGAPKYIQDKSAALIADVSSKLGVSASSGIELTRPDNAVPFQIAASSMFTGGQMAFPDSVFQDAWKTSNMGMNTLQKNSPDLLRTIRTLA